MTTQQIVPPPMRAPEARRCVEAINSHIANIRSLLWELYTRKGWLALGYSSWRKCVTSEFDQSQAYLYRQLQAAEIEQEISPIGEIGKIPESHIRPLVQLPSEVRRTAYEEAVATAPNGTVTSKHITRVAEKYRPQPPTPLPGLPPPKPDKVIDQTAPQPPRYDAREVSNSGPLTPGEQAEINNANNVVKGHAAKQPVVAAQVDAPGPSLSTAYHPSLDDFHALIAQRSQLRELRDRFPGNTLYYMKCDMALATVGDLIRMAQQAGIREETREPLVRPGPVVLKRENPYLKSRGH